MGAKINKILIVILSILLVFSLYKVISISNQNKKEDDEFKELIKQVEVVETKENIEDIIDDKMDSTKIDLDNQQMELEKIAEEKKKEREARFNNYQELSKQNSDMYGWIRIDGTPIDYPVMFTPNDPEYYLHRSFSKKKAYSGCIFMDVNCQGECNNYLLHGHHMKNGTMFAGLMKYKNKEYWESHQIIEFDSLEEIRDYEIIAAFESKVYKVDEDVFKYYNYTYIDSEETFKEYMDGINSLKLYDTGIDVQYGDEFITLSTCAYHTDDGRFVVVGVKKDRE